jgi:hypothetical protein
VRRTIPVPPGKAEEEPMGFLDKAKQFAEQAHEQ